MPSEARVLSVGCRFETELLYLLAYGYRFIRGIDIFWYSPWVDVGDMHAMPYEDSTWDCVLLGWVISYSKTPHTAASEVLRVIRDGGIVAVAVSYYPDAQLEEAERQGTLIGSRERLQTVDALLNLWAGHVDRVYFAHDAPNPSAQGSCVVLFSVRK